MTRDTRQATEATIAWEGRRQELRADFRRILGCFPDRLPVSCEILDPIAPLSPFQRELVDSNADAHRDWLPEHEEENNPDYRRLRIRYAGGVEGRPVFAHLRLPRRLEGPAPAVLCLHGHMAGCLLGKESMSITAIDLARRGFVTLAPDMLPFGERRDAEWDEFEWRNGQGSSHFWGERTWFQSLLLEGRTLQGVHVWELERAVDLLRAMPEVDGERIGAIGHSGGGINTLWLAALDARIACAACNAGVMSYSRLKAERTPAAVWSLAPVLVAGDTPDLLSLVAPRPFLGVESGSDRHGFDGNYNREHIYPTALSRYELYGAAERLRQFIYDGDHDYGESQRELSYAWLERWLRPTSGRG